MSITLPRYHTTTLPRYHALVNMMKVWAWEKYLVDIKSVPRWGYVLLGPSVSHVFSVMEAWIIVDLLSLLLVNCSWPNSAKVRLIPRSLSTAETRGVFSFVSYPGTLWIARSAKKFFLGGWGILLGGSLLAGRERMLGGSKKPLSDISNCCLDQILSHDHI